MCSKNTLPVYILLYNMQTFLPYLLDIPVGDQETGHKSQAKNISRVEFVTSYWLIISTMDSTCTISALVLADIVIIDNINVVYLTLFGLIEE